MLRERDQLQDMLHALRGAEVRSAVPGAGELFLEFDQPSGGWSLGTGGSIWALVHDDEPVVQDNDEESALDRFAEAIGRHVQSAQLGRDSSDRAMLRVDLGDGLAFFIVASANDAPDLPVFELSTPEHRVVSLYPDGAVEDFPSDVPIRDLVASGALHHWPSG